MFALVLWWRRTGRKGSTHPVLSPSALSRQFTARWMVSFDQRTGSTGALLCGDVTPEFRGLFEDTLILWGGEFGRAPTSEGTKGRDHNHYGYTTWLAGGGVKSGFSFGATDEFGCTAVEDRVHVHDLHATILQLMGLDHEKLTYRYSGRDYRLTDVSGSVVRSIIA
jgi:hypothetical protein